MSMSEDDILQLLVDVKSGVKAFMGILRRSPDEISNEEVSDIIENVKQTLEEILAVTDNNPVSEDLSSVTRMALSLCIKIVKEMQRELDTTESEQELQNVGAQFNHVCRDFTEMVNNAFHPQQQQYDDRDSHYDPRESFTNQKGTINFINTEEDFEEALLVENQYVILNISDETPLCQKIKSVYLEMARKYPKVVFCYIDPNRAYDVSYIQGINRFPHFQIYFNTEKLQEFTGANENYLRNTILQYADPGALLTNNKAQTQPQSQYQPVPVQSTNATNKPQQPRTVKAAAPRADFNFSPFLSLNAGNIIEVHSAQQYEKLLANRTKIVALCVTMDTPICNTSTNLFRDFAIHNPHADFVIVDWNEMKDKIAEVKSIGKLPHYRFFKDGKMVKDFGGQYTDDFLRAAVNSIVVKARPKNEGPEIITSDYHTPGQVVVLTKEDQYKTILSIPDVLIIVNMYDYEKISKEMVPVFTKFAEEYKNAIFCSIDVIKQKDSIRSCFGATRLPSFRFFKNGEKLKEWQGREPDYLLNLIKQFIKPT
jgi:thioredoxin-like negative regulator of GroEL